MHNYLRQRWDEIGNLKLHCKATKLFTIVGIVHRAERFLEDDSPYGPSLDNDLYWVEACESLAIE